MKVENAKTITCCIHGATRRDMFVSFIAREYGSPLKRERERINRDGKATYFIEYLVTRELAAKIEVAYVAWIDGFFSAKAIHGG